MASQSRFIGFVVATWAAALLACGEAPPKVASEPTVSAPRVARTTSAAAVVAPPSAEVKAPVAPVAPPAPAEPKSFLERESALTRFFAALAALEGDAGTRDVRVLQLGDSHTTPDWSTAVVRRKLTARFGDGGRGFVALGKPWKTYVQDGLKFGMSREWAPAHARLVKGRVVGDGFYGLTGVAIESSRPGGGAWLDAPFAERVEIAYVAQPGGAPFDLLVDGSAVVRVATKANAMGVQYRGLDVPPGAHHVEVRPAGPGRVRILGAALDQKTKGVSVDSLGRDGARAANLLQWNEGALSSLLTWRDPSLVILAYGTNECGDKDVDDATYERELAEVVGRVVRATKGASCLLLGPPDYSQATFQGPIQHPRLASIIATQRRVAAAADCAFYDQTAAMGGPGAMAAWAAEDPPLARKDGVHLTREGYTALAERFADDLLAAYAAQRARAAGTN